LITKILIRRDRFCIGKLPLSLRAFFGLQSESNFHLHADRAAHDHIKYLQIISIEQASQTSKEDHTCIFGPAVLRDDALPGETANSEKNSPALVGAATWPVEPFSLLIFVVIESSLYTNRDVCGAESKTPPVTDGAAAAGSSTGSAGF
jgi:hypothetical protein